MDVPVIVYVTAPWWVVGALLFAGLVQLGFVLRSIVKRPEKMFWRTTGQSLLGTFLVYAGIGEMSDDYYGWPLLLAVSVLLIFTVLSMIRLTSRKNGVGVGRRFKAGVQGFNNPS